MRTIWDIAQLRPLDEIGRRYGVAFMLRGGVAFRLVLTQSQGELFTSPLDLFELTPFTSDVDLLHTGSPELTGTLLDEILTEVPAGECFRWELQSVKVWGNVREFAGSNLVPARLLEVTGAVPNGLIDPANGAEDIAKRRYRYSRNPLFKQSVRYRQGRDLEVFSALLYLQTLAEANIAPPEYPMQPGWQEIVAIFSDGLADMDLTPLMQQHAYLRSRLRHLLRASATAFPDRATFGATAKQSGLLNWLQHLTHDAVTLPLDPALSALLGLTPPLPEAALATSARVAGDTYQLAVPPEPWTPGPPDDLTLPQELGGGESVLLVSPRLLVQPGPVTAPVTSLGVLQGPLSVVQEFIHVQLPESAFSTEPLRSTLWTTPDADLSAFLVLKDPQSGWIPFALPAVVLRRISTAPVPPRLAIRMNCLGLLAEATLQVPVAAHLVLVGWKAS